MEQWKRYFKAIKMKGSMKLINGVRKLGDGSIYRIPKVATVNKIRQTAQKMKFSIKDLVSQARVNGQSTYIVENLPDDFVDALKIADVDFFRMSGSCY